MHFLKLSPFFCDAYGQSHHINFCCHMTSLPKILSRQKVEKMELQEVKSKLFDTFKSSGIESSLKAQLRIQLLQLLKSKVGANIKPEKQLSIVTSAVNTLIVEYLKTHNYGYSLSVFLPECGIVTQGQFPHQETLQVPILLY
jgi:hypothetical protein